MINTKFPADKIKYVTIIITEKCNLACSYCFEHNKSLKSIDINVAKQIIDKEMTKEDFSQMVCFDFFGGEPFLEFDKIKELTEYVRKKKYNKPLELFAGTNGTLVHGEIQEWLINNKDIFSCGISLDGNEYMQNINRSNSFNLIDIDFFLKLYPNIIAKMTISNETLPCLANGIEFLHKKGIKKINCNLAYGLDWTDLKNQNILQRELNKLVDFYIKNPNYKPCSMLDFSLDMIPLSAIDTSIKFCGAGTHMRTYDINGNLYPCHFFAPFSAGEKAELAKGIVLTDKISKDKLDRKCRNCVAVDICPTCYGSNFLSTGNIYSKAQSYCELTKIMLRATAYLKAQQWRLGQLKLNPQKEFNLLQGITAIQNNL